MEERLLHIFEDGWPNTTRVQPSSYTGGHRRKRSISVSVLFPSVPTFFPMAGKKLQPGFKLEDEGKKIVSLLLQCCKLKPFTLTNKKKTAYSRTASWEQHTNSAVFKLDTFTVHHSFFFFFLKNKKTNKWMKHFLGVLMVSSLPEND